jgi:predicted acylesterase/phospholipase RssA
MGSFNKGIDWNLVNRIAASATPKFTDPKEIKLLQVASIITEADLNYYTEETVRIFGIKPSSEEIKYLTENSITIKQRNAIRLNDTVRNQVLKGMSENQIRFLADVIKPFTNDTLQTLYLLYLKQQVPAAEELSLEDLVATVNISLWCTDTSIKLPDIEVVNSYIDKKELLAPFYQLTKNFAGREPELKQLASYYHVKPLTWLEVLGINISRSKKIKQKPVFITGIGGTGKSTLIAKSILDQKKLNNQTIFIYLDFDRPGLSIGNVFSLAKEALRQWRIESPEFRHIFDYGIELIDSDYGIKEKEINTGLSDRKLFYEKFFSQETMQLIKWLKSPVIIVFDSFEELQYRAKSSDITTLMEFLHELEGFIPQLRPVFVGRSEVHHINDSFEPMLLTGFDVDSASAFLEGMGIQDQNVRNYISQRFDYSPLSLKLAARYVLNKMENRPVTMESLQEQGLITLLDEIVAQEELVTRNLEHIHAKDKRVATIAIPGIIVRSITPAIIQHVLAKPCGLGEIDEDTAKSLYEALISETFLFEYHNATVTFRQDLRRSMYPHIQRGKKYDVKAIHDAAVDYYKYKTELCDKAEYLYHCLMRGDDPAIIDRIYSKDLKPFIEKALIELPENAYLHLAVALRLPIANEKLDTLKIDDWTRYMIKYAQEILKNGDYGGLKKVEELFNQKKERSAKNNSWYEESMIKLRLGKPVLSKYQTDTSREYQVKHLLLANQESEYHFSWQNASLDFNLSQPTWQADSLNGRVLNLHASIQRLRMSCRLGRDTQSSKDYINIAARELWQNIQDEGIKKSFFNYLPYPYNFFFKQQFEKKSENDKKNGTYAGHEVDFFVEYIQDDKMNFRSAKHFAVLHYDLKKYNSTISDLERYLKRNFNVFLQDIAAPGEDYLLFYDAALFIEINPDLKFARYFSSASKFRNSLKTLPLEAFTQNEEVVRCLKKLKENFRKKQLYVSDITNAKGEQCVDLYLQGNGAQAFTLLGYTYVLEQMDIRFRNVKGAGAGALNAIFLKTSKDDEDNRSLHLLEKYCNVDLRKLMEGAAGPVLRVIFYGRQRRLFLIQLLSIILVLPIVFIKPFNLELDRFLELVFLTYTSVIAIGFFFLIYWLIRGLNHGKGLARGIKLKEWLNAILFEEGIETIEKLEKRIQHLKGDTSNSITEELQIVTTDFVTLRKLVFPKMLDLVEKPDAKNQMPTANLVHACMATPVLFKTVSVSNIPTDSESVRSAWRKRFGTNVVPAILHLGSTGIPFVLPRDLYEKKVQIPCFGVNVYGVSKTSSQQISINRLQGYIIRVLSPQTEADEFDRGNAQIAFDRGVTGIPINNLVPFSGINYLVTGEEKINLFIEGVRAATQFLLDFNWIEYRETIDAARLRDLDSRKTE